MSSVWVLQWKRLRLLQTRPIIKRPGCDVSPGSVFSKCDSLLLLPRTSRLHPNNLQQANHIHTDNSNRVKRTDTQQQINEGAGNKRNEKRVLEQELTKFVFLENMICAQSFTAIDATGNVDITITWLNRTSAQYSSLTQAPNVHAIEPNPLASHAISCSFGLGGAAKYTFEDKDCLCKNSKYSKHSIAMLSGNIQNDTHGLMQINFFMILHMEKTIGNVPSHVKGKKSQNLKTFTDRGASLRASVRLCFLYTKLPSFIFVVL
ncbi:hypothetical protein P7K49_014976 [Saguinus oedipus]|uniref:Uncharacterized protein n=1 Tax=Saguinus oedipus TaxID=9490 RepID=A0ABQ9V899_SAGOE|nr:hypothetical protein P7K49_014976 [Saguinus oedipus]